MVGGGGGREGAGGGGVPWNLFSVVYNFGSYYIACLFLWSKIKKERKR